MGRRRSIIENRSGIIRAIATLAVIVAAAAGTYYVVFLLPRAHAPAPPAQREDDKNGLQPKAKFKRPEVTHLQNGREVWRLRAATIQTDETQGDMTDVNALFHLNGERSVRFEAGESQYNLKSRDVKIEGRPTGTILPEGHTIQAASVKWDNRSGTLTANDVRAKFGAATARADRLEIRPDGRRALLNGNVEILIPVGPQK